ncbi:hypothetical protein [Planosporangium mesophilum]|nr:hypothetical protein [Planosporangium mesophilum]
MEKPPTSPLWLVGGFPLTGALRSGLRRRRGHEDGGVFAVAALTESGVPAAIQPAAEAVMAQVSRALHDHLRTY